MSRVQLKERQFEPTGKNLGEFLATDLESFDMTYKDSDEEDSQDGNDSSGGSDNKSKVPDPIDDNPLSKEKKNNSSSGQGGSGSSQSGQSSDSKEDNEGDEPEGVNDIPDEWDPYGENLDDQDPDMPEDNNDSGNGQSASSSGGGQSQSGGSSGGEEDNDVPSQVPNQSQDSSDVEDSEEGEHSDTSAGGGQSADDRDDTNQDGSDGDSSGDGNTDLDDLLNDYEEDSQDGNDSSGGSDNEMDSEDDLLDAPESSDNSGQSPNTSNRNKGSRSNSEDDYGDDSGDSSDSSGSPSGGQSSGGGSSSNSGNINGDNSSNLDYDKDQVPSDEELEAEDDDFDPSDLGTLSDLEKALESIDQQSADSVKERRKSENSRSDQEEANRNSSQKDRDDEIAAAKDIVGKAAKDTQSDDIMNGKSDEDGDDDYGRRYNRDKSESQDDILKDLGAGNLTTLFNPGNLQDWRSRLDKIFDKALGFDIITNPNLTNKKIEDAPPGREDEIPQIKNIAILLDMSASMGAREFKQVIMHIDTMIKARKLTKVWFHIIGFGSSNINDIGNYYSRVKGSRLKQEMMTKYKNDAGWMTDFLPGVVFAAHKVHKPDAVIIMTDAEFNGSLDKFKKDSKASMFMKKNKNKIIWALTKNARLQYVKDYDPTAIDKKRYIKFKKGGHERDDDDWN